MSDIESNLPVRAAAGDVVVNVLTLAGATLDPASEGTSVAILAGLTGLAATAATETTLGSVLAGITGLEDSSAAILAGVTGIEDKVATETTLVAVLAGITAMSEGQTGLAEQTTLLDVLAGVTGIEAIVATEGTQLSVLAGVTALEVQGADILAGVTGIEAAVGNIPVKGQTGMAASMPVVIGTDQTPVPVYITSGAAGTNITQFKTDATVATNGTSVNTYAPASTFMLDRVHAAGSGRIKVEVREALVAGITGPNALKWVAFNSTSEPNVDIDCSQYKVVAGDEVQVIVINLESGKAQDLYSTIVGDLL